MLAGEGEVAVFLEAAQLVGKGAALHVERVGEFLPGVGDVECGAAVERGLVG